MVTASLRDPGYFPVMILLFLYNICTTAFIPCWSMDWALLLYSWACTP